MSGAHHKYSPSSLERRYHCPASARLEEGLPDVENEYGAEGQLLHHAAATGKIAGLTSEQIEAVEFAIGYAANNIPGYYEPETDLYFEKKLRLVGLALTILSEGTPDAYAVSVGEGKAWLIDYKFGWNEVEEPANNWQMAAYAAMIMQRYFINEVEAHVVYPRMKKAQSHTFTDFNQIIHMIESVITACEKPDAPCVPGEKQCKYCKAALHGKCPAQKARFETDIIRAEAALNTVSLDDLTNDEMSKFYLDFKPKMDALAKFWESVKNRVKYRIEKEGSCGVLTLGKGSASREIDDVQKAFELLSPYLTREDFLSCVKPSVPQLESAFVDRLRVNAEKSGGSILVKKCKEEFGNIMGEIISLKPRKGEIEAKI